MSHIDGLALQSKIRFGAKSGSPNQWIMPTSGGVYAAGDLAIVTQIAQNNSSSIPATNVPSGWTSLLNDVTGTGGAAPGGDGVRASTIFKIITAADLGATITGMNGPHNFDICAMLLHFNRPIRTVDRVTATTTVDFSDQLSLPAQQVIAWDSVITGAHLYWGFSYAGGNNIPDTNYNWSVGPRGTVYSPAAPPPDKGSQNQTRTWYSFAPIGENPDASVTMKLQSIIAGSYFYVNGGSLLRLT